MLRSRSSKTFASSPCPPQSQDMNGRKSLPLHYKTKSRKRSLLGNSCKVFALTIFGLFVHMVVRPTQPDVAPVARRAVALRQPLDNVYDVAVLGCGPAGLTAAIFASRAGLSVLVLGSESGLLSDTPLLENFPSYGGSGPNWLSQTREQATALGATFAPAGLLVSKLSRSKEEQQFVLESQQMNEPFRAWSVIVATGATPRHLGLPGEKQMWGKSLHNCAICDGSMYTDKTVLVVGGGDAAVDGAILLARHAKKVILIHRRDEFRASDKRALEVMKQTHNIEIKTPFVVSEWSVSSSGEFHGALLERNGSSGDKATAVEVLCDGAFVMIGAEPNTDWIKGTVDLDDNGMIVLKSKRETSVPGVFAAGEVSESLYRQAITASAEGAEAAIDAERWLRQQHGLKRQAVRMSVPLSQSAARRDSSLQPRNPEECDMSAMDCLRRVVKKYPLVVFSKQSCPYCRKALEALNLEGAKPHVINLSHMGNKMAAIQDSLKALTGRRTVPNVFVGGKSIGGGDETVSMYQQGKLGPLLTHVGAIA